MAFFTFLNALCICLLFVLPFGIQQGGAQTAGDYEAAPQPINWKKRLISAALLAVVITALLALIIKSGIIAVK